VYGLDLTAGDTVSGPPPRAPDGPATLQVRPGLLRGSGATTRGPDSRKTRTFRAASGARTPFPPGRSPTRHVVPRQASGARTPLPSGEGVRPATWCPGGYSQAGPAACPEAASLPRYTSPTAALNARAARAKAAHGLSTDMSGRPADTTVSPPVTKAARHITVRRTAVLRRHTHGKR
jgi:hypothetical protein